MVQCASFKTTKAQAQAVDVGLISDVTGVASVFRDKPTKATINTNLFLQDDLRTSAGRLEATFLDDSTVRLTEHSSLVIDEYVFDPNPSKSKMAISFASGTARFITGKLGLIDKRNIRLRTPTADIAIRGTDFTCTVDEIGRSLIILLPKADGLPSGEILVTTALGTVTLNKPYQATTVDVYEKAPSNPVILDLTLDVIDNILIVSPPKEKEDIDVTESTNQSSADYLDFGELDVDFLAEDFLDNEADLEFTELDINYLDTNFLEDLLNVLDSLAISDDEDVLVDTGGIDIKGTKIGQDTETQITTLIAGDVISVRRSVNDSVRLDLNGNDAYTLIIIQDGVSNVVKINGGGDSVITITQSE